MPNWCEGKLKVRGKLEDIKRFLNEGINLYLPGKDGRYNEKVDKDKVEYDDWAIIGSKQLANRECYVEGTHRGFIEYEPDYLLYEYNGSTDEKDTIYGLILTYKQAWALHSEELLEIAKKYSLDMKIFGIECGMQFAQNILIVNGELKKDDTIGYTDWFWECPDPWCGG